MVLWCLYAVYQLCVVYTCASFLSWCMLLSLVFNCSLFMHFSFTFKSDLFLKVFSENCVTCDLWLYCVLVAFTALLQCILVVHGMYMQDTISVVQLSVFLLQFDIVCVCVCCKDMDAVIGDKPEMEPLSNLQDPAHQQLLTCSRHCLKAENVKQSSRQLSWKKWWRPVNGVMMREWRYSITTSCSYYGWQ